MNKSNNPKSKEDINLRGVFKGFYRKKWWFVGTFIMVLVAGLLVTFIRDKGYNAGSEIEINTIKNSYLYSLQVNFPEEASKLRTRDLKNVSSELESDEILEEVSGSLSFSISKDELLDAIYISTNSISSFVDNLRDSAIACGSCRSRHWTRVTESHLDHLVSQRGTGDRTQARKRAVTRLSNRLP